MHSFCLSANSFVRLLADLKLAEVNSMEANWSAIGFQS